MTAPITNYNVSSGKDLNTIFAPLYLFTNNNDLIIVTQQKTTITPLTSGSYKYIELNDINSNYTITINTNITPQDELTIFLVGGGASGRNGYGGRSSGGGAGGGAGVFKFDNQNVSMGTQFTASIGATTPIDSTTTAGSTSVNFSPTNTYLVQATGGGAGQQGDTSVRAVSGNCLTNLDYAYFGTLELIFLDNSGGIGPLPSANNGAPAPTAGNRYDAPWAELIFSGGGGGTQASNGGNCTPALGGNGIGGLGGTKDAAPGAPGGPGLVIGSGGGAGGCSGGIGQAGGSGKNGAMYIWWKIRT